MANDIDKTSPHYKGEFGSIYEVNQKFPSGGVEGDYVAIDGWAHYWNADRGTWCVNAQRDSYWDELITGIINKLKLFKGATYMGVAGVSTVPEKIAGVKMYYFAKAAGTYSGFGGLQLAQGINVLYTDNGTSWTATPLLEVAQELGVSTEKVMSQNAVNIALDKKADKETVNAALDKKADKETVNAALDKKADKAAVDASLDLKANKSDVVKTNAAQDAEISRKANQQDVERSLNILRKEIGERTVVEGNVNNNPDEEDLTSKMGSNNREVISLKDREYNPLEFSGKGYKILRKNLQEVTCAITKIQVTKAPTTDGYVSIIINGVETHVDLVASTDNTVALVAKKIADRLSETMDEYVTSIDGALVTCTRRFGGDVTTSSFSGVNTETEATISESSKTELRNLITAVMLNQSNCIYEIRYDFDLDGKTLEVPENCTLKFEGGSLRNGTILGNKTFIHAKDDIVLPDVSLSGQFYNNTFKAIWFGIEHNTIITNRINKVTSFLKVLRDKILELSAGVYYTNDSILIRSGVSLIGEEHLNNTYYKNSTVIKAIGDKKTNYWVFDTDIKDRDTGERRPYNYFYTKLSANDIEGGGGAAVKNITIKNIHISVDIDSQTQDKCVYGGMRLLHCQGITLDNISIYAVKTGMYISSAWNTSIGRVEICSNHYGCILGTECTNLKIDVLTITRRGPELTYVKEDALQESVLYNEYLDDRELLSGGLIAYSAAGVIQSLTIEAGWDYAANFVGSNITISFIYYELIKNYLMYFRTSFIYIGSQYGIQWIDRESTKLKNYALYFSPHNSSYVDLNGEFCGDVYMSRYSDRRSKLLLRNFMPSKHGVFYPIKYSQTEYGDIQYDIPSNYIYISNAANNENLGFSEAAPITFKEALKRIKNDSNYRSKALWLLDDVIDDNFGDIRYLNLRIKANNHKFLGYIDLYACNLYIESMLVEKGDNSTITLRGNTSISIYKFDINQPIFSYAAHDNSVKFILDEYKELNIMEYFNNSFRNTILGSIDIFINKELKNPPRFKLSEFNLATCYMYKGQIVEDRESGNFYYFDGNFMRPYISNPEMKHSGTTANRPLNVLFGFIYKNTETNKWEIFNGSSWENLDGTQITDVAQ